MNKAVPIAFICDDNYALPTAVAITSLKLSKHKSTQYDVYVLGMDISEDSKRRIFSQNEEGFTVTVLDKEFNEKQSRVVQVRKRVTPAALLKFELPDTFPDLDKLLYLDSDMLIQKDLSELYNTELGSAYAGVVNDAITLWGKEHRDWLRFAGDVYFNSGMLLLNLKKMREDDIPEKLLEYRLNGINFFMDQDTLNVVFDGKICLLPPKYNLLNCFFEWYSIEEMETLYQTDFPGCREFIYKNAAVLHFGDEKKPWRHYMGEYLSGLYNSIYSYSPYADKPLVLEGDPLARSEAIRAEQEQRISERDQWLDDIRNSVSFRIGRAITWAPRKVRGGIRCCKEHGAAYTVNRFFEHIRDKR